MIEVDRLRVSLTKNGYLKIAKIVEAYPSNEMLDHVSGSLPGVNLAASQVANILCADPATGVVPAFWDEIRRYDRATIKAFSFVAIVLSHYRLIETFLEGLEGTATGTVFRSDMTQKEYTNLVYAMSELELCEYVRGTDQVRFDLSPLQPALKNAGHLVVRLLKAKLKRCGWRDPEEFSSTGDKPLLQECRQLRIHEILGMSFREFSQWIGRPNKPR